MQAKSLVLAALSCTAALAAVEASAQRGAKALEAQGCTKCHAIGSSGRTVSAEALSRPLNREYTPAGLTATLWNHAPKMWSVMKERGVAVPRVSEQEAADMFAYFAALRYFEPMGDAARGARLFSSKKCSACHATGGEGAGTAKPVSQWQSLADPLELAARMWNHSARMRDEMGKRGMRQPDLTAQDLSDILVYLRNLPARASSQPVYLEMPSLEGAEVLLQTWNCATCHTGELSLERRAGGRSMTELAAAMWNHSGRMVQHPNNIPAEELRRIVAWIWSRQLEHPSGDAGRGRRVAETKKCMSCHEGGGQAPAFRSLPQGFSVVHLAAGLWQHGPKMLSTMQSKGVSWPRLSANDVEDLVAWINDMRTRQ